VCSPAAAVVNGVAGAAAGLATATVLFAAAENIGSGASASDEQAEPPRERTAGEIMSAEKKGSINRVFPEQMRNKTLTDINRLAKTGDRVAQTARKLLTDNRYNKE
jgi:hypothetical protein